MRSVVQNRGSHSTAAAWWKPASSRPRACPPPPAHSSSTVRLISSFDSIVSLSASPQTLRAAPDESSRQPEHDRGDRAPTVEVPASRVSAGGAKFLDHVVCSGGALGPNRSDCCQDFARAPGSSARNTRPQRLRPAASKRQSQGYRAQGGAAATLSARPSSEWQRV